MEIKCWGSRGSISVSGKQFLKYGGDTTCIEITTKSKDSIIIDAGTGIRRLGHSLIDRNITKYHLLLTHAHWDHILGIAFFKPLLFSNAKIIIQDRLFSGIGTKEVLSEVMKKPFFPIGLSDLQADVTFDNTLNGSFSIGSVDIETIPTNHTGGGLGYKFTEDGKTFVFLTDNELGYPHHNQKTKIDDHLNFVRNADLLFHDAEYTQSEYKRKKGWGHSPIEMVLDLAQKAKVKKLGLFHLNQERADDEMASLEKHYKKEVKKNSPDMGCFAVAMDMQFKL